MVIGRHLLPDGKLGIGENPVLGGNVIPARVVLNKITAVVMHISAGGVVAAVIDPGVPPKRLIVDIINKGLRDLDGPEVQNIQPTQLLIAYDTGLEVKAIQILREVD